MKKIVKTTGWIFLILLLLAIGYSIYVYQSSPWIKALANNDESQLFYRPSTTMEDMGGLAYDEHILKVEDSLKIHSYTFKPTATSKANIFLIRGNSGNVSTGIEPIQALVNNGFSVYTVDWRGYGKSTGAPNYNGILADTQAAFEDFQNTMVNDSTKTIVYGMSLGGQLAVKIAKDNPAKVDALVLDGSLASAHNFIKDNVEGSVLSLLMKKPEDYNQEYIALRDIADIENMPKLIIHSKSDRAVPFKRGQSIFDAAQEPKEFWETDTEHIRTLQDLTKEAIEKMEALIQ
ncbi:alpha/beta hydrolase [Maribacter sp. 2308TA10-17]|uniref:alpha/beta hydrolase n=1 Tax=Maribacter sp. 2308TA10-17 TaxID=3386276 RepID=UPI0039BC5057